MATFLVLYLVPPEVVASWQTMDNAVRKPSEDKMMEAWEAWIREHAGAVTGTHVAGKTKRVTADGIADSRNDIMLTGTVEAVLREEAARMFATHPHLTIPQASIDIMEMRPMSAA